MEQPAEPSDLRHDGRFDHGGRRCDATFERRRRRANGVSGGRSPQLLAGAVVAEAAMDILGVESLEIGPWALREGVILERLDRIDR